VRIDNARLEPGELQGQLQQSVDLKIGAPDLELHSLSLNPPQLAQRLPESGNAGPWVRSGTGFEDGD
jgi:hypothetical protein